MKVAAREPSLSLCALPPKKTKKNTRRGGRIQLSILSMGAANLVCAHVGGPRLPAKNVAGSYPTSYPTNPHPYWFAKATKGSRHRGAHVPQQHERRTYHYFAVPATRKHKALVGIDFNLDNSAVVRCVRQKGGRRGKG